MINLLNRHGIRISELSTRSAPRAGASGRIAELIPTASDAWLDPRRISHPAQLGRAKGRHLTPTPDAGPSAFKGPGASGDGIMESVATETQRWPPLSRTGSAASLATCPDRTAQGAAWAPSAAVGEAVFRLNGGGPRCSQVPRGRSAPRVPPSVSLYCSRTGYFKQMS